MIDNSIQIEEIIFNYIGKNSHTDTKTITPETKLFREGVFDSMGFVLLIDFLEENFRIKTNDSDLIEENFESVKAITNFVKQKKTTIAE